MPASQNVSGVRYPKRKRTQVKYYQEEEDDIFSADEYHDEEEHTENISKAKKRKSAASSRPLPKQKIFPFLSLPAEIRNQIYTLCLTDPAGVYFQAATKQFRRTVTRMPESHFCVHSAASYYMSRTLNDAEDSSEAASSSETASTDEDLDSEDAQARTAHKAKKSQLSKSPSDTVTQLSPNLLAVCKQIHDEAHSVLWGQTFHMQDTMAMHSFLVDIGPRGASYLKELTLGQWGSGRGVNKAYNHAAFTALVPATSLTHFTFYGFYSYSSEPEPAARQFYRDAFPWLESVGAAKGVPDAAVDLVNVRIPYSRYDYLRLKPGMDTMRGEEYKEMEAFRGALGKLLKGWAGRFRD